MFSGIHCWDGTLAFVFLGFFWLVSSYVEERLLPQLLLTLRSRLLSQRQRNNKTIHDKDDVEREGPSVGRLPTRCCFVASWMFARCIEILFLPTPSSSSSSSSQKYRPMCIGSVQVKIMLVMAVPSPSLKIVNEGVGSGTDVMHTQDTYQPQQLQPQPPIIPHHGSQRIRSTSRLVVP